MMENKNVFAHITPEHEMVLQLAQFRNPNLDRIRELAAESLDWVEILGQLSYNRASGIAYHIFKENSFLFKLSNREVNLSLYLSNEAQSVRTRTHRKIIYEMSKHLQESKIPHAFLKGSILANSIYPLGCRISSDVDILLNTSDLTACGKILKGIGYIQGFYDRTNDSIRPADRKEIIQYRMNYGEIVPFLKKIDEPGMPLAEIDINFSLSWMAQGTEDAVSSFLQNCENYELEGGHLVQSFQREYFLAHLCAHLYKEACVLEWVKGSRDLGLYKFIDIYAFVTDLKKPINWAKFVEIAKLNNIIRESYYSLIYTRELFPLLYHDKEFCIAIEAIKPEDTSFINEVVEGANPNNKYVWTKPFLERFFDYKRYYSLKKI